jgi:AraC-like DNA-binding protein
MTKFLIIPNSGKEFRLNPAQWGDIAAACRYDSKRLAVLFGMTPRNLCRKFAEEIGASPQEWLDMQRVVAAKHLLVEAGSVKEVGLSLGFRYPANFHRHFKKYTGIGPSRFVELRKDQNVRNS